MNYIHINSAAADDIKSVENSTNANTTAGFHLHFYIHTHNHVGDLNSNNN